MRGQGGWLGPAGVLVQEGGPRVRVVQIVGVPYSGSTVLGYILNATPGWFFGSEVYRLLPAYDNKVGGPQKCAFCGDGCPYWEPELLTELRGQDRTAGVSRVYEAFASRHRDVDVFIDGTNSHERYAGSWSDTQVVAAKHPLRLASSHLYNQPERFGLGQNPPFADFRATLAEHPAQAVRRARWVLRTALHAYRKLMQAAPHAHVVRTDALHEESFAELARLREFLGSSHDRDSVVAFSRHEVHPIGGNKAPFWQRVDAGAPAARQPQARNERREYYTRAADQLGDYRVDDKWRELLPDDVIAGIVELPPFEKLSDMLGYGRGVPAGS